MWSNIVQQVFLTWANWSWSKEYISFGPTDNQDKQFKFQVIWSKEYRSLQKVLFNRGLNKISASSLPVEMVNSSHYIHLKLCKKKNK